LCNQTDGGEGTVGRKLSAEEIAKRTEKVKGSKRSAETRAKMSASMKGIKRSAEARANISAAHKGKPNGRAGTKHSIESQQKMSIAAKNRSDRMTREERSERASKAAKARWANKNLSPSQPETSRVYCAAESNATI